MPNENLPLILHPGSGLARVGPLGGRIVVEMVAGALALTQAPEMGTALAAAQPTAIVPRFRIGDHEFCEPDYQQILLWAGETHKSPLDVVLRLEHMKSLYSRGEPFPDGRLIEVYWDYHSMLIRQMRFVEGLKTKVLCLRFGAHFEDRYRTFGYRGSDKYRDRNPPISDSLFDLDGLSELEVLDISSHGSLTTLDLSRVSRLTVLRCDDNQLAELDLSTIPQLTELECSSNSLAELGLSSVPQLTVLSCGDNQLTELDLSAVPQLTVLRCNYNQLCELNLSSVPQLTELHCEDNQLIKLDIRPLEGLTQLTYDKRKTHLIKRPDQNF